ncbi:head-tail joining protein [Oceanicaulis sp.]|uniref:head-tail joining protein n=1 Tax=Oceanicaulis sp. TaxID=1924941 RepID=UPI003D2B6E68
MAGRVFAGVGRAFTTALGESVTYTPQGGAGVSVQGVFTRNYVAVGQDGDLSVESVSPAVSLQSSDAPSAAQGDGVTVGAHSYEVVEVQPDGFGMVVLILHEV